MRRRASFTSMAVILATLAGIVGLAASGPAAGIRCLATALGIMAGAVLIAFTARRIIALLLLLKKTDHSTTQIRDEDWPNLLLLIPCRNEAAVLPRTIDAVSALEGPRQRIEVRWIDDGSIDATAELLRRACEGREGWQIFTRRGERSGTGKPAALNAALAEENWADAVVVIDADDRPPPDFCRVVATAMASGADAVQLPLVFRNASKNTVTAYSALEQIVHQAGTARILDLAGVTPLLGHAMAVRLDALRRAGGFPEGSRAEDVPLTAALHNIGGLVRMEAGPAVSHLAPETIAAYMSQHRGWARGFASAPTVNLKDRGISARLAFASYKLGYADRPAMLLAAALALLSPITGVRFPWALIAAPLLAAALFATAALIKERAPLGLWLKLCLAPAVFAADLLASTWGSIAAAFPDSQPWKVTPKAETGGRAAAPGLGLEDVWAVVVNYGEQDLLEQCMESLGAAGLKRSVLVSNGINLDWGRPQKWAFKPGWDVLYLNGNRGYAAAANLGLATAFSAGARAALLCNPDAILDPDSARMLIEAADRLPEAACVGATVLRIDPPSELEGIAGLIAPNQFLARIEGEGEPIGSAQYAAAVEVDFPLGCTVLITGRGYERIGGLDPGLYCYHDEMEWCHRARLKGLKCYVEPRAKVGHRGPSPGPAMNLKAYFLGRNAEKLSMTLDSERPGLRLGYVAACMAETLAAALGRAPHDGASYRWRLRGRRDARRGRPPDPWIMKRLGLVAREDD